MAKTQRPIQAQTKNSKEFVVWSVLLTVLLAVAGGVLYSLREDKGHIHIPENAFEDVKPAATAARGPSQSDPNTVLMPRNNGVTGSTRTANGSEVSPALQQAMDLVDRGQWNEAEPLLRAALAKDPKNVGILLELAMIQILDKNSPAEAQPYLEEAMRVDPTNDSAMKELLNVYEEGQNIEQGLRFVNSLPVTDENRGLVSAVKGALNLSAGNNQEAVNQLRASVYEYGNTSFDARADLATAHESQGNPADAIKEYEAIISESDKPEQQRLAKIRLAQVYEAERNYSAAMGLLEPLLNANPKDKIVATKIDQIQKKTNR
ncbi:MAG: tetratricopeptide repeat protein [Bdellovibrionota bacterium]|nr:MAG: tetratricopeptide repeat protein [Pseudomonadota bacterium]